MAIIVFLNEQEQTVTLVDGTRAIVLPWTSLGDIASVICNREVYYVTSAEFVPGQSVVDLLSEITGQSYDSSAMSSSKQYMRCTGSGKLICRTPNGELVFNGPTDFKSLDSLPENIIETSDNLRTCLEMKKVEIVDESRKQQILTEAKTKKQSKNARDKSIDRILIKTSVDDFLKNGTSSSDDFPEIDVSATGSFKKEDDQEVYSNLKKLGITPEA